MKRIASPLFESTQMAQYSFWFVFGMAAMPACRRMYVFAATGRNGTACSNPGQETRSVAASVGRT